MNAEVEKHISIEECIPPTHGIFRIIWSYALSPTERCVIRLTTPGSPETFDADEAQPPLSDIFECCIRQSWTDEAIIIAQIVADYGGNPIPISDTTMNLMVSNPALKQALEYCACSHQLGLGYLLKSALAHDTDMTTIALGMVMETITRVEYSSIFSTCEHAADYRRLECELCPYVDISGDIPGQVLGRASRYGNILTVKKVLLHNLRPLAISDAVYNATHRGHLAILQLLNDYRERGGPSIRTRSYW